MKKKVGDAQPRVFTWPCLELRYQANRRSDTTRELSLGAAS